MKHFKSLKDILTYLTPKSHQTLPEHLFQLLSRELELTLNNIRDTDPKQHDFLMRNRPSLIKSLDIWARLWLLLWQTTGYPWYPSSWIRKSTSHITGHAMDFAPALPDHMPYGPFTRKDPFLNLRVEPFNTLSKLKAAPFDAVITPIFPDRRLAIIIESDHIHCYLALKTAWLSFLRFGKNVPVTRYMVPKGNSVYYKSEEEWTILKGLYRIKGPLSSDDVRSHRLT